MSRELKIKAAEAALDFVENGMRLGIGTGSTADEFIKLLGQKVASGLEIAGVPTSVRSASLCEELNIPLTTLDETPELDLTVDGADEVDRRFVLIKGGGGALLREKIVAAASAKMVVIVDDSKLVETLGEFPLPIEVNRFGLAATRRSVEKVAAELGLGGEIKLRYSKEQIYETDGGHFILDSHFGRIPDARALSSALLEIPGVVQHGLFIDLASVIVSAGKNGAEEGRVEIIEAS